MDISNQTIVKDFVFRAFINSTRFPVLLFTILLFLFLSILLVNILTMLIIMTDLRLHTPMYFFICALGCLDICYTTTIVPKTFVSLLNQIHSISFISCATQMFTAFAFGITQILLITIMAYDRYVAICNPLRYKTIMRWIFCKTVLAIAFIISFTLASVLVFTVFRLPFCNSFQIYHFYCDVGQVLVLTCPSEEIYRMSEVVVFSIGLVVLGINLMLILTSYIFITAAILKIQTSKGRKKAFSTCSSHISVVFVEFACLGFVYLQPKSAYSLDKNRILTVTVLFASSILNPVIYSVRNKAVKRGFIKLIGYNAG